MDFLHKHPLILLHKSIIKIDIMRVYCENYGCTMNRGDAELMLGQLAAAGHEVVQNPGKADAIIVNTCAVKGTTHRRMLRRLKELRNSDEKRVVVAGCLPLIDLASIEQIGVFAGIVSCRSVGEMAEVFERIAREEQNVRTLADHAQASLERCERDSSDLRGLHLELQLLLGQVRTGQTTQLRCSINPQRGGGCNQCWLSRNLAHSSRYSRLRLRRWGKPT
ncbi:MAG: hypothetical protein AVW05_03100 [Hadesarchaea archaeon DG-33]|nr:MAG: hypothetical protein AVW05_03100 [Hadesarchaea archaeon DG-33]